jgi:hypothetical protein
MKESTKPSSHPTNEIAAYHITKRIYLNLMDMEKEDPEQLQKCEFRDQDFELVAD